MKKNSKKKKLHLQEGVKAREAFETAMKGLFRAPKAVSKNKGKD